METTRKFARTMEEAFGPGHRGNIWEESGRPMDLADRIVVWTSSAVALGLIAWAVFA